MKDLNLYSARNSVYCYPNTNILINKFNIQDNKILKQAEEKIVAAKLFVLRQNKMIKNFDINHFKGIHKFLFEDIYPFAGEFRNENIAKGFFCFAEWQYIEEELTRLLTELNKKNNLKNISKNEFIKEIAYYMSELNVLHPFREGNGRTIREFIRELCYVNGYLFDLQQVDAKEFLEACKKSVVDTYDLEKLVEKSLKNINSES